jgi:hypothetical protein
MVPVAFLTNEICSGSPCLSPLFCCWIVVQPRHFSGYSAFPRGAPSSNFSRSRTSTDVQRPLRFSPKCSKILPSAYHSTGSATSFRTCEWLQQTRLVTWLSRVPGSGVGECMLGADETASLGRFWSKVWKTACEMPSVLLLRNASRVPTTLRSRTATVAPQRKYDKHTLNTMAEIIEDVPMDTQDIEQETPPEDVFMAPSIHRADDLAGKSYSHFSDVPKMIADDMAKEVVLGVDEAGRGPVLGMRSSARLRQHNI